MAKAYITPNGWRKTCCTCKQEFGLENFHKSGGTPDGLARPCKACCNSNVKKSQQKRKDAGLGARTDAAQARTKISRKAAYDADPEKYRERSRINRQENAESTYQQSRASKIKRKDHYREYALRYYHENKASIGPRNREQVMRRYATKGMATPAWSDRDAVLAIYRDAFELTSATGIQHQVDHIIPILSKIVCGLHVHTNLQILKKSVNISKGNRMWPGHPDPEKDMDHQKDGVYLPSKRRDALDAVTF